MDMIQAFSILLRWLGVTQAKVADLAGINRGQFNNWLRGIGPLGQERRQTATVTLRTLVAGAIANSRVLGEEEKDAFGFLELETPVEVRKRTKRLVLMTLLEVPAGTEALEVNRAVSDALALLGPD